MQRHIGFASWTLKTWCAKLLLCRSTRRHCIHQPWNIFQKFPVNKLEENKFVDPWYLLVCEISVTQLEKIKFIDYKTCCKKVPVAQFGKVEFVHFEHLVQRFGHLLCEISHVAQFGEIVYSSIWIPLPVCLGSEWNLNAHNTNCKAWRRLPYEKYTETLSVEIHSKVWRKFGSSIDGQHQNEDQSRITFKWVYP